MRSFSSKDTRLIGLALTDTTNTLIALEEAIRDAEALASKAEKDETVRLLTQEETLERLRLLLSRLEAAHRYAEAAATRLATLI